MKILIAGGTGLIGSRLVNSLTLQNHNVVILSRNPLKHKNKFDSVSAVIFAFIKATNIKAYMIILL